MQQTRYHYQLTSCEVMTINTNSHLWTQNQIKFMYSSCPEYKNKIMVMPIYINHSLACLITEMVMGNQSYRE
jgi:hypothetical protein